MKRVNPFKLFLLLCIVAVLAGGCYLAVDHLLFNNDTPSDVVDDPDVDKPDDKEPENEFAVVSYYHKDLLERYEAYQSNNPEASIEDIVTTVNMGNDAPFYSRDPIIVEDPHAMDVIVNKVYALPDDFVPDNLVVVDDFRGQQMVEEAAIAFRALNDECEKHGFTIHAYSGYRSIEWQTEIYNNMLNKYGEEYTNSVSSKPTHSEHHTGLAMDVCIDNTQYDHSHENPNYDTFYSLLTDFGFILRFPEGKDDITGYQYESWHIRYLGVDLAKEVAASGLTYEEFVARK